MQVPGHPHLTQLASTMASSQAKVAQYMETLIRCSDELTAAAAREDWDNVRRTSAELVDESRSHGYRAVSAMARRVYDEAHRPDNSVGIKRSLIRLIGTCGHVSRAQSQDR